MWCCFFFSLEASRFIISRICSVHLYHRGILLRNNHCLRFAGHHIKGQKDPRRSLCSANSGCSCQKNSNMYFLLITFLLKYSIIATMPTRVDHSVSQNEHAVCGVIPCCVGRLCQIFGKPAVYDYTKDHNIHIWEWAPNLGISSKLFRGLSILIVSIVTKAWDWHITNCTSSKCQHWPYWPLQILALISSPSLKQ